MLAGLQIRPWQEEDAARLAAGRPPGEAGDPILAPSALRTPHGEVSAGQVWLRALAAVVDGEAVGGGAVWSSRWHPARLWAYVEVTPDRRRRGVGTALLAALRRLAEPDGRPLRTKVRDHHPSGAFATAAGLRLVLIRSTSRELDPAGLADPPARVVAADLGGAEVCDAFRRWYGAVHPTDPPGVLGDADIRDTHLGEAAGGVIVRHPSGSAAGIGLVFDDGSEWGFSGGGLDPVGPDAVDLARDLILGAARLVPSGTRLVLEVDDSMADMAGAADLLGASHGDTIHVVAER
ncbi:MAG: GNAT family N-acetyltransferase [Acidimicrobiia bacterium]